MEKNKEKWISLKEAAKISGYSPDYIGEMIRKGKIPGKQVYYNIAWMTTAEALLEYKQREKKKGERKANLKDNISGVLSEIKQKILWEMKTMKLFVKTFKYVLPIIIILVLSFSMLLFYLFSVGKQEIKTLPEVAPKEIEQQPAELEY